MPYEFPAASTCWFCSHAAEGDAWQVVEGTPSVIAVAAPKQRMEGAAMVAPRRHVSLVEDLDENEACELMQVVLRISRAITVAYRPDGLNTWWAAGVLAAQAMTHLHVDLVPRYTGVPYLWVPYDELPFAEPAERRKVGRRLRAELEQPASDDFEVAGASPMVSVGE